MISVFCNSTSFSVLFLSSLVSISISLYLYYIWYIFDLNYLFASPSIDLDFHCSPHLEKNFLKG